MTRRDMGQQVLVTGGAGFIGSHLVARLLELGHSVRIIDNLSTGRRENIAGLKGAEFIEADIADMDAVGSAFDGVDTVFHLAALADIVPSIQNPLRYHRANVDGTVTCLEASRQADVARFVYAASSSCYGIPDAFPTDEKAPVRPMYPYALTKFLGEQAVLHWQQVYGLPAVSLRFFNVYGPGARTTGTYGAVFGVFLAQKINGQPLTIVGDGSQTRDFTFVSDVVEALIAGARSTISGDVFNVGSGGTYSVKELVEMIGGEAVHIPKRPGEPDCTFADISKIRDVLGWSPRVPFREGVAIMMEHIEDWRRAPVWNETSIAEATQDWHTYLGAKA